MQLPEGLPCARARCSEKPYFGKANRASLISPSAQPTFAKVLGTEARSYVCRSRKAAPQLSCTPKPELGLRGRLCNRATCRPPGSARTSRTLLPELPCPGLTRPPARLGTSQQGARGWGPAASRQRQPHAAMAGADRESECVESLEAGLWY